MASQQVPTAYRLLQPILKCCGRFWLRLIVTGPFGFAAPEAKTHSLHTQGKVENGHVLHSLPPDAAEDPFQPGGQGTGADQGPASITRKSFFTPSHCEQVRCPGSSENGVPARMCQYSSPLAGRGAADAAVTITAEQQRDRAPAEPIGQEVQVLIGLGQHCPPYRFQYRSCIKSLGFVARIEYDPHRSSFCVVVTELIARSVYACTHGTLTNTDCTQLHYFLR